MDNSPSKTHAPARALLFVVVISTLIASLTLLEAQAQSDNGPVLLRADSVHYDQNERIISALGNVEISMEGTILIADKVTYNERTDAVIANGNISILHPNGDVLFADFVELHDRLRSGFLVGFGALLSDQSRFAASTAERIDGNRTEMTKVVYSACHMPSNDCEKKPLWQIKAHKIVHSQTRKRIDYQDVILELFGLPVAYLPYFSHADPSVKRKTGFLTPSYGSSSQLGLRLEMPYYFNISPQREATFAPVFTSKEGIVIAGGYREKRRNGEFGLEGSFTLADEREDNNTLSGGREIRGHIFSTGRFQLDEIWRFGYDIERATDDTYLRRYDFSDADTLTSNAFIEGFDGRNYTAANIFSFQGLREADDPGLTPLILPIIDYNHIMSPGTHGQRMSLHANLLSLTRSEGTDSQRVSLGANWKVPYTSPLGEIYSLNASLRGDLYYVDDVVVTDDPTAARADGFTGRLYPKLAMDWRFPHTRKDNFSSQIVEPIVSLILAPNGGNPGRIPNEDSVSFEFDDTNVFSPNRFPGLDRVEGGARINYGFRLGAYHTGEQYATALLGQVLRLNDDDTFADKTGLEGRRSDYVGTVNFIPSSFIDYSHRFRLDRDTLSIRRNEINLSVGPKFFVTSAGYVSLDRELTTDELESREELNLSSHLQLTRYWSTTANTRRDLTKNGGTLNYGLGVVYKDECLLFTLDYKRDFTQDRDVRPSSAVTFRIKLKNIG